jgi:hypothetical protein
MAAALLAINLADLFVNSALILPVLVAAGGLAAWTPSHGSAARQGRSRDGRRTSGWA